MVIRRFLGFDFFFLKETATGSGVPFQGSSF
jgi:hypothetical protein